ncbi:MAG: leucine-rich repeat protein [Bacillota bacterium]
MNKYRLKKYIALILMIMLVACIFTACNGTASKLSFSEDSYIVYANEGTQFTLDVVVWPKSSEYTLTSSNAAIVSVLDDGETLEIVSYPGIVTITATSGENTATCTVQTRETNETGSSSSGSSTKSTYTVTFYMEYGSVADQEITPGGYATVPTTTDYMDTTVGGWYTDSACTEEFDFANTTITADITLYAKFVAVDSPTFTYVTINSLVYVSGLKYSTVNYGAITLPTETDEDTPREIYGIYEEAFAGNTGITSVTIPSSYSVIQTNAFNSCTNLVSVEFEGASSINTIGEQAFAQCTSLESIDLPTSLVMTSSTDTALSTHIFAYCTSLTSFTFPSTITYIPDGMFYGAGLESIDLINITYVGFQAFYDATNLASATNTASVTNLRGQAFYNTALLDNLLYYSATNTAYLDDILLYTTLTTGNTIVVEEGTRLVASLAVYDPDASNVSYVEFESDTPISLCSYAIGSHVDIIVAEDALSTYNTAWSTYTSQIYYESQIDMTAGGYDNSKDEAGILNILVRPNSNLSTETKWNITVISYYSSDATYVYVDEALYDLYGFYVKIDTLIAGAFSSMPYLAIITVPANIEYFSMGCFDVLSGLLQIKFTGWCTTTIIENITLATSAIKPLGPEVYKIYVPEEYLSNYKTKFSSYASRLVGYADNNNTEVVYE